MLFDLAGALLAIALARKRFLGAALLTGLQVKRMPLDLFHNVFLLHFTFKTAKSTFECLAVLQMNFRQLNFHHLPMGDRLHEARANRFIVTNGCGLTPR